MRETQQSLKKKNGLIQEDINYIVYKRTYLLIFGKNSYL